jgi:carbonic anhydrase
MTTADTSHVHHEGCGCLGRRTALGLALTGLAVSATGAAPAAAQSLAPATSRRESALTKEMQAALTPDSVLKLVMEGNDRFASGRRIPADFLRQQRDSAAKGQFPAAIFLTCVDSRAPVEVICDLSIGDAFNARVAGNVINDDILGSMEFATAAAGAKLVMVMGHTKCGAVAGAIDNVKLGNLTLLLARFGNAIAATPYDGEKSGKNDDYVNRVAATQVRQTLTLIRERSPVLRGLEQEGKIRIVGSMYDLGTGRVTLLDA